MIQSLLLLLATARAADPVPAPAAAAPTPTVEAPAPKAGPDRSKPPPVADPVLRDLPEPEEHAIGNVKVHFVPVEGIRKVALYVRFDRGSIDLAGKPTEWTTAMNALWGEETDEHGATELSMLLDLNSIELNTALKPTEGGFSLFFPKDRLDVAVGVGREVLATPEFTGKDTKRWVRDRHVQLTLAGPSSQAQVADAALSWAWYPADHPFGARPDVHAAENMSKGPLVEGYAKWLASAPLELTVIGDLSWSEAEPALKRLVDGYGAAGERTPDPAFAPAAGIRVIGVDMPGQEQVAVRLRTPAPLKDDPDQMTAWTLNWALGGNFLSRLNSNLRELRGYTYGARSSYLAMPTRGAFTISVDVPKEVAASTIMEIDAEMQRVADGGLTSLEIDSAWRAAAGDWNDTFANAYTAFGTYDGLIDVGDTLAEGRARTEQVKGVVPRDTRRVAARYFGAEAPRVWVLVGDRKALEPQLAGLGWTVQWVGPADAYLGAF